MRSVLTFIIMLLLSEPLLAQTITTFAGNGVGGVSGDGGPATNASIYCPTWGVFDKSGNYYIASQLGHTIRKIDIAGTITTVVGTGIGGYNGDGGLADTSELDEPGSVTVDSVGNIFIVDNANQRIRKVDVNTNLITTIAGNGIQGYGGDGGLATLASFNYPNDLCFDKFGNLYISDMGNFRIRKIDPNGIITTVVGNGVPGYSGDGGQGVLAKIGTVRGIAADSFGNLFIADLGSTCNCVRKLDATTGIITTVAGTGPSTNAIFNGDNIPALSANISPSRVAFDKNYNFYISDNYNSRVRKVDKITGIITTVAGDGTIAYGGDGGPATSAQLNSVSGIAFDSCDNMYITEVQDGRIRKVTFNDTCDQLSVEVAVANEISVYPNPTIDKLNISSKGKIKNVTITNVTGQILLRHSINKEQTELNIEHLKAGIYFLTVTDVNGLKFTKKIIKE